MPAAVAEQALDRIVAVVNDDVILESELDSFTRQVKAQLLSRGAQLPPDSTLRKQALERMVVQKVQLQLADKTNIRVTDEQVNRAISRIAAQNNLNLDQFRIALEREGYSFVQFREKIRDDLILARLQQRNVENRVQVTDQEIDNQLNALQASEVSDREYHLGHILVAVPEAASANDIQSAREEARNIVERLQNGADFTELAVAHSDDQHALDGGDMGWIKAGRLPNEFVGVLERMQNGQIAGPMRSPSGFHVFQLKNSRGNEKHFVPQLKVRHILLKTNALVTDEDARIRLEQLRERLDNGEDFAELARAHSEDPVSARKGGDLGWLSPGDTVPAFEAAAANLSPGEISEPVESRFGWHLIQVLDRRRQDDTEEFRRTKAREHIHARKSQEALELWLRRLRDEAYVEYRLDS